MCLCFKLPRSRQETQSFAENYTHTHFPSNTTPPSLIHSHFITHPKLCTGNSILLKACLLLCLQPSRPCLSPSPRRPWTSTPSRRRWQPPPPLLAPRANVNANTPAVSTHRLLDRKSTRLNSS